MEVVVVVIVLAVTVVLVAAWQHDFALVVVYLSNLNLFHYCCNMWIQTCCNQVAMGKVWREVLEDTTKLFMIVKICNQKSI